MDRVFRIFVFFLFFVCSVNAHASLIGDTVSVDRRFGSNVLSSRIVNVDSGIELIGWDNFYIDFREYDIIMYPMQSVAYSSTKFNGFDFYDLDFAAENEVISSVEAYFVSTYNHGLVTGYLDPARLGFSDHSISLDMAGSGFGSYPMYISIDTSISAVPLPPSFLILLPGISMLLFMQSRFARKSNSQANA